MWNGSWKTCPPPKTPFVVVCILLWYLEVEGTKSSLKTDRLRDCLWTVLSVHVKLKLVCYFSLHWVCEKHVECTGEPCLVLEWWILDLGVDVRLRIFLFIDIFSHTVIGSTPKSGGFDYYSRIYQNLFIPWSMEFHLFIPFVSLFTYSLSMRQWPAFIHSPLLFCLPAGSERYPNRCYFLGVPETKEEASQGNIMILTSC